MPERRWYCIHCGKAKAGPVVGTGMAFSWTCPCGCHNHTDNPGGDAQVPRAQSPPTLSGKAKKESK